MQTTRDCGAAVRYWPAGRGETEAEGETYFGFSAVEPSGTTSGTTHAQGTRDCGAITPDSTSGTTSGITSGTTHAQGARDCGVSTISR